MLHAKSVEVLVRGLRFCRTRAMRILVALDARLARMHGWVLLAYVVLLAGLLVRQYRLYSASSKAATADVALPPMSPLEQSIQVIASTVTYSFAALNIVLLVTLFLARRWSDPIGKEPKLDDSLTPIDSTCVSLELVDEVHDFERLCSLADEALSAWGPDFDERQVVYRKFLAASSSAFLLIRPVAQPEAAGLSCVLPVSEDAFRKLRLGILGPHELSSTDIRANGSGGSDFLCINIIYLRRIATDVPSIRAVKVLCHHIAMFLRCDDGSMSHPLLVAEGSTVEGRRFLVRYGFDHVSTNREHVPIYQLDMSRPGILSDRARLFYKCVSVAFDARALTQREMANQ